MDTVMRRLFAASIVLALSACGGSVSRSGGSPAGLVPAVSEKALAPDHHHRKRVSAYAQIIIPRHHRRRKPDFISSATRGIKIVATYTGPGSSSGAFVQTTIAALGSGAPGCKVSSSSAIVCVIAATVWEGADHIVVTTYDTPPSGGKIPPSANIIGMATVDTTITGGTTPYIPIFLGGEVGSIHATPLFSTVPADGSTHDVAIAVAPRDFGNQRIVAGKNDPYANPISVTLSETGTGGHAFLVLNTQNAGSSATLKYSSDALSVRYNGNGNAGYSIKLALAATGAPTENAQVSPLIVEGTGVVAHALGLNGTASTPTLTITEKDVASTQSYVVAPAGCAGIAAVPAQPGTGASATFTVNGGATGSASGCSLTITDGLYNTALVVPVTNTPIKSGPIQIGGAVETEYTLGAGATPGPLAVGPDGHIWFSEGGTNADGTGGANLVSLDPGTGTTTTPLTVTGGGFTPALSGITTGPDGALWINDIASNTGIHRVTTAGGQAFFNLGDLDCGPAGILSANGSLWTLGCRQLYDVNVGGGFTSAASATASGNSNVVQGPDGALYYGDGAHIDRYDPIAKTFTQIAEPNGASVHEVASAPTDGANGAIWYTAQIVSTGTQSFINRVDVGTQTAANPVVLSLGSQVGPTVIAGGIVAGADGGVWFTDQTDGKIYRLSFAAGHAATIFPVKTAGGGPFYIILGPDGSLWFNEAAVGKIGHLVP